MILDPVSVDPPALTVPTAAARIGVSLYALDALLSRRPDLAARLFRAGNARLVMPDVLADLRAALAPAAPAVPEAGVVA